MIADIRMSLGADFERKKCALIVEGEDDLVFFTGKLSPDVYLYESFSGKKGVKEIIESFDDERVIGICDRDYQESPDNSKIYFYDYCCLEMMLISNDSSFSSFCYAHYQGETHPLDLRKTILEDLSPLSFYRKLNEKRNWAIRFRGINFGTMCNPATHRLDLSRLETQINQLNPHDSNVVQGQMQEAKNESDTVSDTNSLLMVTQGHDFLNYFHQLCSYSLRQHVVLPKAKELCRSLLCSYRLSDFKSTNLYHNLTSIQQASNRTIVLE